MDKLGYTWYPENWWTSNAFYELEDYPIVRYVYLEIISLLYTKNGRFKITQRLIKQRFRVELDPESYDLLKSFFKINADGIWESEKVIKRISRANSSRENGKKGGRPKNPETQKKNLEKPTFKRERERERERENKSESESEIFIEDENENETQNEKNFFRDGLPF